jgi:membrane protein implicated in regulation of membrane protease activity
MVGGTGVVRYGGQVFANGELWRARTVDDSELVSGETVTIEGVDESLVLEVRRISEEPASLERSAP